MTLDQNVCCCWDCLLSPEPHGLMDEEGLKYLTGSEHQEALMESSFRPCGDSPPLPTTPPSDIDEFTCPSPQIEEGWATSFGYNVAFNVVPDLEEENDILPLLENMVPIPSAVGLSVLRAEPGEIDFIPFQVRSQWCKRSKGVLTSTYHPYYNCVIKG